MLGGRHHPRVCALVIVERTDRLLQRPSRPRVQVASSGSSSARQTRRLSRSRRCHAGAISAAGSPPRRVPRSMTAVSRPFRTRRFAGRRSAWTSTGAPSGAQHGGRRPRWRAQPRHRRDGRRGRSRSGPTRPCRPGDSRRDAVCPKLRHRASPDTTERTTPGRARGPRGRRRYSATRPRPATSARVTTIRRNARAARRARSAAEPEG